MNKTDTVYTMRDVLHRPVSIRSTKGSIVVTSKDDCCDHVLCAGESLHIRPRGILAIRSLSHDARAIVYGGSRSRQGRDIEFHAA